MRRTASPASCSLAYVEIEKRGGTESLKEDATELTEIAKRKDSLGDKAKAAKDAISKPGADRPAESEQPTTDRQAGPGNA